MKVKCINAGNFKNLTIDKYYVVLEETTDRYIIDNDNDVRASYAKKYFEEVTEVVPAMGAAPVKKAKPKPKTVIGVSEIIDRCAADGDIHCDDIEINEAPNSCGVAYINGLNGIFEECEEIISDPSEHIDVDTEQLSPEVTLTTVVREALRRMFAEISIRTYTFFMFTTNDSYPECVEVFKSMCREQNVLITEDMESRTSGNMIFVAVFNHEQIDALA